MPAVADFFDCLDGQVSQQCLLAQSAASGFVFETTTVCPALSLVHSTWQIGFYEGIFIENPTQDDFAALGCQMYRFVAEQVIAYYNGKTVDVTLQSLSRTFFSPVDGFGTFVILLGKFFE